MATVSKGRCYLCGAELGKTAMKNHILKVHGAEEGGQECVLLKIEGADKNYWLYVDMPVTGSLTSLDSFLRKIWLECCGHLSEFSDGRYHVIGKGQKIGRFQIGDRMLHQYDFGDTTETLVSIIGSTTRKPQRASVRLLARNNAPVFPCAVCGKEADYICCECLWESDNPFFCEECVANHEHEYMLPVTNSPRMGVCAYAGELDTFTCPFPDE